MADHLRGWSSIYISSRGWADNIGPVAYTINHMFSINYTGSIFQVVRSYFLKDEQKLKLSLECAKCELRPAEWTLYFTLCM